jgi:hypothetical protein
LNLNCEFGFVKINFAAYGTTSGYCGNYTRGECDLPNVKPLIEKMCLGQSECSIPVSPSVLGGDPCVNVLKHLSVEAECYPAVNTTSWDFTFIDPLMEDFMNATKGHDVIINFSTTPEWLWNTPSAIPYPNDPNEVTWTYTQGKSFRDPTLTDLKNYYKRLVSWYTKGGFTDEYGVPHKSGLFYKISHWEILNEIQLELEHAMTPELYVQVYDAMVSSILEVQPNMKFVGLALAGIDPTWFKYFLNASNHLPGIPLDYISFHYYVIPNERTNVNSYAAFFDDADSMMDSVRDVVIPIRDSLSQVQNLIWTNWG